MSGNPRGRGGGRGDFQGNRGGGGRGGGGSGRGDVSQYLNSVDGHADRAIGGYQGNRGGGRGGGQQGRGDHQGNRGDGGRGGRGGAAPQQMAVRSGPPETGGIFLAGAQVPQPDASITKLENDMAAATRGKMIDGFPGRPGYGTKGRPIVLRANYFHLQTAFELGKKEMEQTLYRYAVDIQPADQPRTRKRRAIEMILASSRLAGKTVATDYANIIVTTTKLDFGDSKDWIQKNVVLPAPGASSTDSGGSNTPDFVQEARARNTIAFRVQYTDSFTLQHIISYLRSQSLGAEYVGRIDVIQLLNIILCKAPNAAASVANLPDNKFYPHQGHPGMQLKDLTGGLIALRGYFSSVRPAVGRLLVNLNVTSGAFYKPLPMPRLIQELNSHSFETQEAFIRMLKVRADYKPAKEKPFSKQKTIAGFARMPNSKKGQPKLAAVKRFGNANEVRFRYSESPGGPEREITVADYFRNRYGITLQRPDLPVLNVGTVQDPQYVPQELCTVLPGQAYRRLLNPDQTTEMLGFAARFPNQNAMSIAGQPGAPGNGLRLMRLADPNSDPQAHSVQPFGFRVSTEMITVPGRVLPTPTVAYGGKTVRASNGSWNCANQRFFKPGKFTKWAVLVLNRKGNRGNALDDNPRFPDVLTPEPLFNELARFLGAYGLNMGQRLSTQTKLLEPLTMPNRPQNDKILDQSFAAAEKAQIPILFVVLPEYDKWLYARIKYYADTRYGIHTIGAIGQKLQKPKGQGMYMGNLALKFNLKGGGINHNVPNTLIKPLDNNTMLMGIDVTHPSPGSTKGAPSIACVVASKDQYICQWPGSIRKQKGKQEMVSAEERKNGDMVNSLEEMVVERLECWRGVNRTLPSKILVYRDGVSESQYDLILQKELPSFHAAFKKIYGDDKKWPKVAIIVVGKRHHTRFYPTKQEDADYNAQRGKGSWNCQPGTVVDRGIAGKYLREFWLQAHQGLQGTARSAHYVVIKDDIGFGADELEQITHHLCYMFARATKAVSVVPPAYYADILAERGRAYMFTTLQENLGVLQSEGSTSSAGAPEWDGNIHPRLKDSTWYV